MEPAIIGAISGVISAGISFAGFWLVLGGRLTAAEKDAKSALQVAAEVEESVSALVKQINDLEKDLIEVADRVRREFGETVNAMQKKIHEFETWARDEFVRKQSLEALMTRTEKAQELRDDRLEKRLDRIEKKLDDVSAFRGQ